jgi:hypothetical protein
VSDRGKSRSQVVAASSVAGEIGLYDFTDGSLGVIDTIDFAWGYEKVLPQALDMLEETESAPLDAHLWLAGAVPFVGGLFARGPEFNKEFSKRLPAEIRSRLWNRDSGATRARLIDLQVLLAPIMAARWAVVHAPPGATVVTNDRGYALATTPSGDLPSYVVPLSNRSAVVITPRRSGAPLMWSDGRWMVVVESFQTDAEDISQLNRSMAAYARRAVFGETREAVEQVAASLGGAERLTAGLFPALDPASHLYDYFRVLSVVDSAPETKQRARPPQIDWNSISRADWSAPIVVEVLFPKRTRGGVRIADGRIEVDLAYGIEQRRARRATGDRRQGALTLVDLADLQAGVHRIDRRDRSAVAADAEGRRRMAQADRRAQ